MEDQERLRLIQIQKRKLQLQQANPDQQPFNPATDDKPLEPLLSPFVSGDKPFDTTGEHIATGLAEKGIHPNIAATAGTAFQMIPDLLMTLAGGKGAKAGATVVKEGAEALGETAIGQALKGTGQKAVSALSEKAATLPLKQTLKKTLAESTQKEAGAAIGKAEKLLNIAQKDTSTAARRVVIATPEKMARFADRASRLAEKGADKLAEMASPETLQFYRKTAEDALSRAGKTISKEAKNKLYQTKQVFTEAIGKTAEGKAAKFNEAVSRYKEIGDVIKKLPAEAKREKQLLTLALQRAKGLAKSQAGIRDVAGKVIGGAATGVGLGGAYKLFK